jgi:superfamily II DNA or RNA helicase
VVNCALLIEGWDQPVVDCIVMASPTHSGIVYYQCVGRGTRLHPDKRDCLVLDLANVSGDLELQSLPVLFGEDPKARTRRKTTVIAPATPDGYEDVAFDEFPPVAIEEATATEVDLLGDRERLSWIAMGER